MDMKLAVIGTAGRDKSGLSIELWQAMFADLKGRIEFNDHLVSGGAAWADHLAVTAYMAGLVDNLTLHLPAPFDGTKFVGPEKSAASAANYYHQKFSRILGVNTLNEIAQVIAGGASVTYEPIAHGYGGLFTRNKKVAKADGMIAYTFGIGDVPADGGTKDTWDQCRGNRVHVSLHTWS